MKPHSFHFQYHYQTTTLPLLPQPGTKPNSHSSWQFPKTYQIREEQATEPDPTCCNGKSASLGHEAIFIILGFTITPKDLRQMECAQLRMIS